VRTLQARDHRAVLWGAGLVAGGILVFRGGPEAARAITTLQSRTESQVATLGRVENLLAREPAVRDSLSTTLRDIVALAPDLVDGTSAAAAQASLSALLSLAADRHSVKVLRVDPLPDSAADVFHRVAIHLELEGDLAGVSRLLASIESGHPVLTVSALAIETPDPAPHPRTPEGLHVVLDVAGYYLPRGGP
jgi:hypothetical protein